MDLALRYQSSSVSSCQICFDRSSLRAVAGVARVRRRQLGDDGGLRTQQREDALSSQVRPG